MNAEKQLEDIFETLGKGFILDLMANTKRARQKHLQFSLCDEEKFENLKEEFEEVREAFYTETEEHTKEELLDVATVCLRWYNGE